MEHLSFRAWSKDHKVMLENCHQGFEGNVFCWLKEGQDIIIMQFSGLKDSEGVNIYEGDIVYLAGYGNYEVKFPFTELYDAMPERDIGAIIGCIYS